ncbi:MAG: NAD-dependent epimerase/dehydratase family protein [Myxococcales bacterium]|nr:NAD-dependent epimerase/dehydratase family protein [Myxococcales bacterium]
MSVTVVTGATGHLGNVLVRELLSGGHTVRAVVQPKDDTAPLAGLDVELMECDVREIVGLTRAFAGAEFVFHLAGIVCITAGQRVRLEAVNVGGTRAVVAACQAAHVGRLIHMGSVHALTEPHAGVLDETAGFEPELAEGDYGKSKAKACREVQQAVARGELEAVLVLPTGVVGPFDFRRSEMGQLLLDLEAGKVPFLPPGGHDFVDVRDVALGTLAAAKRGRSGEAYLLGGERLTIDHIARLVHRQTGARLPKVLPTWMMNVLASPAPFWERLTGRRALLTPYAVHALSVPFTVSHQKAAAELDYAPRRLDESLRDALAWHHAHRGHHVELGPGRSQR